MGVENGQVHQKVIRVVVPQEVFYFVQKVELEKEKSIKILKIEMK